MAQQVKIVTGKPGEYPTLYTERLNSQKQPYMCSKNREENVKFCLFDLVLEM